MNPLKSQNLVAKIIQIYAYLNAIAGLIIALVIIGDLGWIIAFLEFGVVLVASFLLFALGEIVELLHQIKTNTTTISVIPEELPEI